jgi:hypothetical protein
VVGDVRDKGDGCNAGAVTGMTMIEADALLAAGMVAFAAVLHFFE